MEMFNSEVTKSQSKFFYIPYVVWKIDIFIKNTENSHFWLIPLFTDYIKYVVESPEIVIKTFLLLSIKREKV